MVYMGGKAKNNASRSNQITHYGVMGGLAPSTNVAQGVKRFRLRRARNKQTIPVMPIPGLEYMKEKDILSKNPAGSGGVGLSKVLVDRSMGPCNCGGENTAPDYSNHSLPEGWEKVEGDPVYYVHAPTGNTSATHPLATEGSSCPGGWDLKNYANQPCRNDMMCSFGGTCLSATCDKVDKGDAWGKCHGPGWPAGDVGQRFLLTSEWPLTTAPAPPDLAGKWVMEPVYVQPTATTGIAGLPIAYVLQGKWVGQELDGGPVVTVFAGKQVESPTKKYRNCWVRWWIIYTNATTGAEISSQYSPPLFAGNYPGVPTLTTALFSSSTVFPDNWEWGNFAPEPDNTYKRSGYVISMVGSTCQGDSEWDVSTYGKAICTADKDCSAGGLCNLATCDTTSSKCQGPGWPLGAVGSELAVTITIAPGTPPEGGYFYTGNWKMKPVPGYSDPDVDPAVYGLQGKWTSEAVSSQGLTISLYARARNGAINWWLSYGDTTPSQTYALNSPTITTNGMASKLSSNYFAGNWPARQLWFDDAAGFNPSGYKVAIIGP